MNESQERREELLRMSRQKWRKGSIPAVHPRYQHVYMQYPGGASKVSACIQGIIWRTFFRRKWRKQFFCADVYQFPYLWDVCGGRLYRRENLEIYALTDRVTD